jgi:membrane-associated protein
VFLGFDIVGGVLWGGGVTVAGYFLGNVPFVHQNLEKIILAILFVSLLPALIAAWRGYLRRRRGTKEGPERMPVPD